MEQQEKEGQDLQLTLGLHEVNLILEAVGQLPFAQVHDLIAKIHTQAEGQIINNAPTDNTVKK